MYYINIKLNNFKAKILILYILLLFYFLPIWIIFCCWIFVFVWSYISLKRVCSCPQWSVWLRPIRPSLIAVTTTVTRLSTVRRTAATPSSCPSFWIRALTYTPGRWTAGRLCTAPPAGDTSPSRHVSCAGGQRSTPWPTVSLHLCSSQRETLQRCRPSSFCCLSAACRRDWGTAPGRRRTTSRSGKRPTSACSRSRSRATTSAEIQVYGFWTKCAAGRKREISERFWNPRKCFSDWRIIFINEIHYY